MRTRLLAIALAILACAASTWAQPGISPPHIGYVYPAGGQQGTGFEITVGGQYLQGVNEVYISGGGVDTKVVGFIRALNRGEIARIAQHARARRKQLQAEEKGEAYEAEELQALPDHPVAKGIQSMGLVQLASLLVDLFDPKRQPNAQIGDAAYIEIAIAPDAEPGVREIRLGTPTGITNPMVFHVGTLPEVRETVPASSIPALQRLQPTQTVKPPVVINGQVEPGEVDEYRFHGVQGRKLVIETRARQLVPYLADAVPGWFQATLALYDSDDNELAFTDDFRFNPDPVMLFEIPRTADYRLEIRDSIYRGREDFVYRISIGELPFVTESFPLGGPVGEALTAQVQGWNLPVRQLTLDTSPGGGRVREAFVPSGSLLSNPIVYGVDELPETMDAEPNNAMAEAQAVTLPVIVNGRIGDAGDIDRFRFTGAKNDRVVAEVHGRRLNSPIDSLVRLTDSSGKIIAWNDDTEDKGTGLNTHHADSYVAGKLPDDGAYVIELRDAQNHGGDAYAYRLRISAPRPDFELRVNPSSINMRAGCSTDIWVHALRRDDFEGAISVELIDAPEGFSLAGGVIPEARDQVHMTLKAPSAWIKDPFELQMKGVAAVDGEAIERMAMPVEDMMQAFLNRHLAPSQLLMAKVVRSPGWLPTLELTGESRAAIPAGGTTEVRVSSGAYPRPGEIRLQLSQPPDGISVGKVAAVDGGVAIELKAGADAPEVGYADNLIVEAFLEVQRKKPDGTPLGQKRRVPLGVLPAIPFEVVQG